MSARVGKVQPGVTRRGIESSLAVRSIQWTSFAKLANWLSGVGTVLVPAHPIGDITNTDAEKTFNYHIAPRFEGGRRLWLVRVEPVEVSDDRPIAEVSFRIDGGSQTAIGFGRSSTFAVGENVTRSADETTTTLGIEITEPPSDFSITARIHSACLYEVPRTLLELDNASESAADIETARALQAIFYGESNESVQGITDAIAGLEDRVRRCGMFHWAKDESDAATRGFTEGDVFAYPPPLLLPAFFDGDTQRTAHWRVYARATGGGTGEVTVTMANGATATIDVGQKNDGSFAWWPNEGAAAIDVDAEDITAADGRRGSRWDDATFSYQVRSGSTAGAQIELSSISVVDPKDETTFEPSQVDGYALRLRADTARDDANGVFQWNDLAGSQNNQATQSTDADKPGSTTSNANFNGEPTVDPDPSSDNQWMVVDDQEEVRLSSDGNYWVFVARGTGTGTGTGEHLLRKWGASTGFIVAWESASATGPGIAIKDGSGNTQTANHGTDMRDGNVHIVECWFNNDPLLQTISVRVDKGSTTTTNVTGFSEGTDDLGVFGAASNGARPCDGEWADIIAYNKLPSSTDRGKIVDYLNDRYDVGL